MTFETLEGGFADPARDAARAFRACLNVMARPGKIEQVTGARPPQPLSEAAGTLIQTLCDADTPVVLIGDHDCQPLRDWITFHTNAPLVQSRREAAFAVGSWSALLPLDAYAVGTDQYPDRSATLIVELPDLSNNGARLSGPGIRDIAYLNLPEPDLFSQNHRLFPCGLDFYFTAADRIAALPRSTHVEVA